MDEYAELAAAIIRTAVTDYRETAEELLRHPRNEDAKSAKQELVRFFRSDWFAVLSDTDGEILMIQIERLVQNDCKRILRECQDSGEKGKPYA